MLKLTVRPAVLLFAAGILGLAGCSSPQPGTALPSTGVPTSASGGKTTSTPAGPSSPAAAGTSSIDPCSLLSASDLTQYGTFSGPDKKNLGGARVCAFQRTLASASDKELGVSINVRDTQGISTVNDVGGGKETGTVNGRKAIKASAPSQSACLLALAVGDNARVDVSITADSAQEACTVADKVADVVEPKLPKG
jgi:hypothetical protein